MWFVFSSQLLGVRLGLLIGGAVLGQVFPDLCATGSIGESSEVSILFVP